MSGGGGGPHGWEVKGPFALTWEGKQVLIQDDYVLITVQVGGQSVTTRVSLLTGKVE